MRLASASTTARPQRSSLRISRNSAARISICWVCGARLLDEFMDRSAVHRFQHYAANHAGYRWKPKLALVLPKQFSLGRPTHRRDLSVALEVLASIMDHYNIDVVSDSPDAARLFHKVVPFSHEAISASAGALVLLSRRLNDEISTIRPSRYVAADPCVYRMNEQRIVFAAGGVEMPFAPASEDEIAQIARGCVSVLLNEDGDVPSFVEALRRLLGRGLTMSLTLSSRADEAFSQQIHAALNGDSRIVIHDSEPCRFAAQSEFQISNDLVALSTQKKSPLPRYLFGQGRFWRVSGEPLRRSDFYLFRGEEATAHGLLKTWLGPRQFDESRSATAHPADVVEPLVSIVVPVSDQVTEVIRLAHSIYQQDYSWIEVIFVSCGSPPETLEAIRVSENQLMKRRFRIRVIELARAWGSATIPRDIGIRASSGDMICILDPDDWLEPGFFAFLRGAPWRSDTLFCPRTVYHDQDGETKDCFVVEGTGADLRSIESAELASVLQRTGGLASLSGVCFARNLLDQARGDDHRLSHGKGPWFRWWPALAGVRVELQNGRVNTSIRQEVTPL